MIDLFQLPNDTTKSGFVLVTAGVPSSIKCNLAASSSPTTTSDASVGYAVGSIWINTTLKIPFVCVDSTNGAAVWRSFTENSLSANYGIASGTNTYSLTLSPALTAYVNGQVVFVRFTNANTGASTLNVNGVAAKNIFKNGIALVTGDIQANSMAVLAFNTSDNRFDMVAGGTASSGTTSTTIDPLLIIGG